MCWLTIWVTPGNISRARKNWSTGNEYGVPGKLELTIVLIFHLPILSSCLIYQAILAQVPFVKLHLMGGGAHVAVRSRGTAGMGSRQIPVD